MGMFDSVWVNCPKCNGLVELQSKAGDCTLTDYAIDTAPPWVLIDILNDPEYCRHCGNWFALVDPDYPPGWTPTPKPTPVAVKTPTNPTRHFQGMQWWPTDVEFTYADLEASPHA